MDCCATLWRFCGKLTAICVLSVLGASTAAAQLRGHNIPGDYGLQSGTQAPPGIYVVYLGWFYTSDAIKTAQGDEVRASSTLTTVAQGPGLTWALPKRLFGAHVGGTAAFPFLKNQIEANSLDVDSPMKYSDTYIQPFQLGWHFKRGDIVTGYGIFLPTGKFEPGGTDNSGLGMYSHEISLGTTLHLDAEKAWHAAVLGAYEIHTKKKDIDQTVGDLVTLEGGLGRSFYTKVNGPLPFITNVGLAAYAQFKATSDSGSAIPASLQGKRDRIFAAGPEMNIFIPKVKLTLGGRFLPEFRGRLHTQGKTFVISAAYVLKPFARR